MKTGIPTTSMASLSQTTILFLLLLGVFAQARDPFACDSKDAKTSSLPFCKVSMPIPNRVTDLLGRLTMQEKVRLLVNNAAAVPRLGIKGYEWWSEALHGVSNVGPGTKFGGAFPGATSFPQVITTAASFNATLWEAIGRVTFSFFLFLSPTYNLSKCLLLRIRYNVKNRSFFIMVYFPFVILCKDRTFYLHNFIGWSLNVWCANAYKFLIILG